MQTPIEISPLVLLKEVFVRKVQMCNRTHGKRSKPEEKGRIMISVELAKKRRINQGEKARRGTTIAQS